MREQGRSGFVAAGIEVVTLEFDSLVGDADPRPLRLDVRRGPECLDRACEGVRYPRIVGWVVALKEFGGPVVVGGAQVGAAGTGGVPISSAFIGDDGDAVSQG